MRAFPYLTRDTSPDYGEAADEGNEDIAQCECRLPRAEQRARRQVYFGSYHRPAAISNRIQYINFICLLRMRRDVTQSCASDFLRASFKSYSIVFLKIQNP
ncbi:hypothetical protein EVAR_26737_1 [Eumeta japonica]|uniref:Uncharacterized protein n=1 Tax=Eumeta variegata TaxID=151549 RepID=A0A4C1XDQ8_EUMVA|nr:hypothetical protein EVAR_26737_1 [Eumeta japonica]